MSHPTSLPPLLAAFAARNAPRGMRAAIFSTLSHREGAACKTDRPTPSREISSVGGKARRARTGRQG